MVDYPISVTAVLEEQRDFLICFLFLLKYTDKKLIHQWLKRDTGGFHRKFFHTVHLCIQTFKYLPKQAWLERMMESSEVKSSALTKASIESFYSAGGMPKRSTYRQQREKSKAEATGQVTPEATPKRSTRAFKQRTLNRQSVNVVDDVKVEYNKVTVCYLKLIIIFLIYNFNFYFK